MTRFYEAFNDLVSPYVKRVSILANSSHLLTVAARLRSHLFANSYRVVTVRGLAQASGPRERIFPRSVKHPRILFHCNSSGPLELT